MTPPIVHKLLTPGEICQTKVGNDYVISDYIM